MAIKTGSVVSHTGAQEWGVGKVMEVTATKATIQFSDGKERKIAASHFMSLEPAEASSFVKPAEPAPVEKPKSTIRATSKKK